MHCCVTIAGVKSLALNLGGFITCFLVLNIYFLKNVENHIFLWTSKYSKEFNVTLYSLALWAAKNDKLLNDFAHLQAHHESSEYIRKLDQMQLTLSSLSFRNSDTIMPSAAALSAGLLCLNYLGPLRYNSFLTTIRKGLVLWTPVYLWEWLTCTEVSMRHTHMHHSWVHSTNWIGRLKNAILIPNSPTIITW